MKIKVGYSFLFFLTEPLQMIFVKNSRYYFGLMKTKILKNPTFLLLPFAITISSLFLSGCITSPPPIQEYTIARAALDAAKSIEAAKYSAGYWHTADDAFRKAKILYDEKEYDDARELFNFARQNAEKAENSARLIRQKNGEVL